MTDLAVLAVFVMEFALTVFLLWLLLRAMRGAERGLEEHGGRIRTLEEAYARLLELDRKRRTRR